MDLKVLLTSNRGYNYLLVARCNNSRFIVREALKTRQAKEVVEAIFQNLICAHVTNISKIYCDLDSCFKNEIMEIMTRTLGIKVQFCSVDAHQANPAERSIQDVSRLLLHYIAKYGNTWCYFHKACCFCLNSLPIGHLGNISPNEIQYGRSPPVLSDLQLLSDNMIKPFSYNFADYLDLLNERFKSIRSIVMGLHNEQVSKVNAVHGAESISLRDFHEGDIVYCHFPSKCLIAELGLQSKKI